MLAIRQKHLLPLNQCKPRAQPGDQAVGSGWGVTRGEKGGESTQGLGTDCACVTIQVVLQTQSSDMGVLVSSMDDPWMIVQTSIAPQQDLTSHCLTPCPHAGCTVCLQCSLPASTQLSQMAAASQPLKPVLRSTIAQAAPHLGPSTPLTQLQGLPRSSQLCHVLMACGHNGQVQQASASVVSVFLGGGMPPQVTVTRRRVGSQQERVRWLLLHCCFAGVWSKNRRRRRSSCVASVGSRHLAPTDYTSSVS
jgi:hypothetical protein